MTSLILQFSMSFSQIAEDVLTQACAPSLPLCADANAFVMGFAREK